MDQLEYKNYPKIRLKEDSFSSIEEIITTIVLNNCPTYNSDNTIHFLRISSAFRSDMDIFGVIKFYFPEATVDDFITAAAKLLKKHKIESQYCRDIERQVFTKRLNWSFYLEAPLDCYGVAGNSATANALREKISDLASK